MMRRALMAAAALLLSADAASAAPRSSLPWGSGVSYPGRAFGEWRGQPVDILVGWLPWRGTWESETRRIEGMHFGGEWNDDQAPLAVSLGVPLLMEDSRGRFAECAAGAFDGYVTRIAAALREKFGRPIIVRLGWEWTGTSTYPWYAAAADPAAAKACFARQSAIYNREIPGVLIELAHNKGKMAEAIRLWPGDDYPGSVNISGVHFYDRFPTIRTEADWQAFIAGHAGPEAWLQFARERGVWMAVAEWGVSNGKDGGFDNPLFVRKMHEWFRSAAGRGLIYEAYFNRTANKYQIFPQPSNPRAADEYRRLWSGGDEYLTSTNLE